jgi:predicted O-linked N-acetylglucosamine transferase (SPINDLY family)
MANAPQFPNADLLSQARQLHAAGQFVNALAVYDRIIATNPRQAAAFCGRGDVLMDLGRVQLAIVSYDQAINLDPSYVDAHDFKGIALAQMGRLDEALASLDRALGLSPDNVNTIGNRASLLHSMGRLAEALLGVDRAIALLPDFAIAHVNRGSILVDLGRTADSIESFDRAIALQPGLVDAHFNRAMALAKLERAEDAAASYKRVLEIEPGHKQALSQLAELTAAAGRQIEAAGYFGRAFAVQLGQQEDAIRQSSSLADLKRKEDELETCRQAVARTPNDAAALGGLAVALANIGRQEEALDALERGITLDPNHGRLHRYRSAVLANLGRLDAALESYDRGAALDRLCDDAPDMRLLWSLFLCNWDGLEPQISRFEKEIEAGAAPETPFTLLLCSDSPALQRKAAETYSAKRLSKEPASKIAKKYPRHSKIRLGYFSADFQLHATMQLIAEMLEAHDRSQFELFAFSFGGSCTDAWRRRAVATFDHFLDASLASDLEVVQRARELEIDIAVDLKGFTQGARTGIFAERAAPIQVNFLGYPGTMGAHFDYVIADRNLIPDLAREFYSEKIAFLPGSYQPNCRVRDVSDAPVTRSDLGLPEGGVAYCCFNQSQKISPRMFESWMRILGAVEGSALWLWAIQSAAAENLRRAAESHGIDPARIVFATTVNVDEHLNRLRLADVFLDTLPYNAHTTASDALRMGVPIVTCVGESFAARVASSLLHAVEAPELVTTNLADYEALAIELGKSPQRLAALKEKLRLNVATSTLFDGSHFARKLESAYLEMYERHHADEPPADLFA